MDDLRGKTALITGASRGIGRSIAVALAHKGVDIAINYRTRSAEAAEAADVIERCGVRAACIRADVSIPEDVTRLLNSAADEFGAIDILVNNAGIAQVKPYPDITVEDWDELMRVNLRSCFLVTQGVLPSMRERKWGRVINLSSVAAHVGGVVGPHYAASKAGMLGLTHFYASALFKEGITVNAISPALIETDMVASNLNARPDRIPVGRFGRPEETAEVAVMLASNGYITGQTIHVNGGWYLT
jgi:3-oxoacyl-[acyl-carrier protein] reductase